LGEGKEVTVVGKAGSSSEKDHYSMFNVDDYIVKMNSSKMSVEGYATPEEFDKLFEDATQKRSFIGKDKNSKIETNGFRNPDGRFQITIESISNDFTNLSQNEFGGSIKDAAENVGTISRTNDAIRFSTPINYGMYKNAKGKWVHISTLKNWRGSNIKNTNLIHDYGKVSKLSKHARKYIPIVKFTKSIGRYLGPLSLALDWTLYKLGKQSLGRTILNTMIFGITSVNPLLGFAISTSIWAIEKVIPFFKELWEKTIEGLTRLEYNISRGLYYPGR
jgi:hypothetical protein